MARFVHVFGGALAEELVVDENLGFEGLGGAAAARLGVDVIDLRGLFDEFGFRAGRLFLTSNGDVS